MTLPPFANLLAVFDPTQLPGASAKRATVLRQLALDGATAEAVRALRERGVRSILLKGPAIARWLYPDPAQRPYCDIDLLVAPPDFPAAEAVLSELGYQTAWLGLRADEWTDHERHWTRSGSWPAEVDLHRALYWAGVDPSTAWALLSDATESMELGHERVEVLGVPARALLLALHAAFHGPSARQPLTDLELALARHGELVWRAASTLAERLGASEPFAAGLRLVPEGRALAGALGLRPTTSVEVRLLVDAAPQTAIGFERLREQRSNLARARFLGSKLFPSPTFMRRWQPLAGRGRGGLLAAYAWRPLWLAWMAPRGAMAWRRTRRIPSDSSF